LVGLSQSACEEQVPPVHFGYEFADLLGCLCVERRSAGFSSRIWRLSPGTLTVSQRMNPGLVGIDL